MSEGMKQEIESEAFQYGFTFPIIEDDFDSILMVLYAGITTTEEC